MFEVFGIISALLLTCSSIPLAVASVFRGTIHPPFFSQIWFMGSWGTFLYLMAKYGTGDPVIMVNYSICSACATICLFGDMYNERRRIAKWKKERRMKTDL